MSGCAQIAHHLNLASATVMLLTMERWPSAFSTAYHCKQYVLCAQPPVTALYGPTIACKGCFCDEACAGSGRGSCGLIDWDATCESITNSPAGDYIFLQEYVIGQQMG